ncbi:Aldehyde dehydrogenase [Aphelenchoides bicaudatus]|nr:Aldehyde dehydrogenase [Aphelenchoides bicaudatus]
MLIWPMQAKTVTVNKWFNCGQVCLSPDYVLINKKLVSEFLEQLREAIKNEYVPNPKEAQNYSRMINERHFHRIESYIKSVQGELLYKSAEENDVTDKFVGPHVFQVSKEELLKHEEVFGPVLLVVAVESFDESIEIVNSNEKCLSLYMITGDEQKVERLTNETSSGSLTINDMIKHFAIAGLPFGGVGESGMGSYHAKFGFDTFTHKKAVLNKRL